MYEKDILFCIFYYLGYVSIIGAFIGGLYITLNWRRNRKKKLD